MTQQKYALCLCHETIPGQAFVGSSGKFESVHICLMNITE